MSYSTLYHSPWHNPGLFILGNGALAAYLLLRKQLTAERAFLQKTLLVLALLAIVDATLTGELAPFPGDLVTYVAIPFVILGDARFFFLLERYAKPAGTSLPMQRLFMRSMAWALIVPTTAYATKLMFFPERTTYWLFLIYETYFTILALMLNVFFLPKWLQASAIGIQQKRWVQTMALFVLAFYALWASADVIILGGHDEGYLLRLVPNIMYYVVFGWLVALSAPKDLRP